MFVEQSWAYGPWRQVPRSENKIMANAQVCKKKWGMKWKQIFLKNLVISCDALTVFYEQKQDIKTEKTQAKWRL